jgi:hypothetical protein
MLFIAADLVVILDGWPNGSPIRKHQRNLLHVPLEKAAKLIMSMVTSRKGALA